MALDRLRLHNIFVDQLQAPSEAAIEVAEAIDDGIESATSELATRRDLEVGLYQVRLELLAAIKDEMNRLLRWLMVAGISIGGAIIALLIALIARGS